MMYEIEIGISIFEVKDRKRLHLGSINMDGKHMDDKKLIQMAFKLKNAAFINAELAGLDLRDGEPYEPPMKRVRGKKLSE